MFHQLAPILLGANPDYYLINALGLTAYALATLGALWVTLRRKQSRWLIPAGCMLLLLLDVRYRFWLVFSNYGRLWTSQLQVYASRYQWQGWLLLSLILTILLTIFLFLFLLRQAGPGFKCAILGCLLGGFAHLLMALSWHETDLLIYRQIGPLHVVNLAWITASLLVLFGSWKASSQK